VAKFCQPFSGNSNDDGATNRLTSLAASGGDDKTIRIWSCERAVNLATYSCFGSKAVGNNGGGVRDLVFLPSGMSLAACGTDGFTRLFDLRSDAVVQILDCNVMPSSASLSTVDCLSVHPNGTHLMCSTSDSTRDGRVLLFDMRSPSNPLLDIPSINSIGKNKNATGRLTTSPPKSATGRRRSSVGGGVCIPTTVTFSPDGSRFAASLKDNAVRIYNWNGYVISEDVNQRRDAGKLTNGTTKGNRRPISDIRQKRDNGTTKANGNGVHGSYLQIRFANEIVTKDIEHRHHRDVVELSEEDYYSRKSLPPQYAANSRHNAKDSPAVPSSMPSSSWKYDKDDLPEILSSTLDRIVGQLDILAQTVIMLERRLTIQESAMEDMQCRQQQMVDICNSNEDDGDVLDSGQKLQMVQMLLRQSQLNSRDHQEGKSRQHESHHSNQEFDRKVEPSSVSRPCTHEQIDDDATQSTSTIDERVHIIMQRYSLLSSEEE